MSNQVLKGFLGENVDIAEDIDIAEDDLEGETSESGSSVRSSTPTISPEPEGKGIGSREFLRQNQQKMHYLIEEYTPPAKVSFRDCWFFSLISFDRIPAMI